MRKEYTGKPERERGDGRSANGPNREAGNIAISSDVYLEAEASPRGSKSVPRPRLDVLMPCSVLPRSQCYDL